MKLIQNSNFRVQGTLPNRMNFRKGSKRQLTPTPTPQNGPYFWKSCACFSYYRAIIYLIAYMQPYMVPPICEGSVSIMKQLQHNFPKKKGRWWVKGRLDIFRKFIRFGTLTRPLYSFVQICQLWSSLNSLRNIQFYSSYILLFRYVYFRTAHIFLATYRFVHFAYKSFLSSLHSFEFVKIYPFSKSWFFLKHMSTFKPRFPKMCQLSHF